MSQALDRHGYVRRGVQFRDWEGRLWVVGPVFRSAGELQRLCQVNGVLTALFHPSQIRSIYDKRAT